MNDISKIFYFVEGINSVIVLLGFISSGIYVLHRKYSYYVRIKILEEFLEYSRNHYNRELETYIKEMETIRIAKLNALQKIIDNPQSLVDKINKKK